MSSLMSDASVVREVVVLSLHSDSSDSRKSSRSEEYSRVNGI
jgi:hypothetical protein